MATDNPFSAIERLQAYLNPQDLLEGRYENDGNDNPIYVGMTPYPNGSTSDAIWWIQKIEYSGEAIVRKRLPDEGPKFAYSWDDRASYFS